MNSFLRSRSWRWIISTQTIQRTAAVFATLSLALIAGCRQDMHNQPKFYPQRGTSFFADGRSVRPQVENTVARGQIEDSYFATGLQNGVEGNAMPFPVTTDVMARGQERYNIFCTPCHSRVGNGAGMIVQRGYAQAGNFHTTRLMTAPLGHFFSVITNGYGAMPNYASQLSPEDRWAVVAYIRALQLSQNATQADVAPGAHVEPLADITTRAGFDNPHFASEWGLPPTAVAGTPDGQPYVIDPKQITAGAPANASRFPRQGELGRGAQIGPGNPITSGVPQGQDSTGYPPSPPIPGPSHQE